MSARVILLGVDGGGSKTEFVCCDGEGVVISRVLVGSTYHPQIGVGGVARRLAEGLEAVLRPIGAAPDEVAHVFFGLPAFGEDDAADVLLVEACGSLLGHDRFTCDNDMVCGWAGSLGLRDGINLVAGTGSIAYGERAGRSARSGGWSEVFGDEGSGHWIGMRGLRAFSRMSDGRDPAGPLHAALVTHLGLKRDLDVCAAVLSRPAEMRERVASLTPVVVEAAEAGDMTARSILAEAGVELAELVLALRRSLGFPDDEAVPLSWSGSIVSQIAAVREAMLVRLGAGAFDVVPARYSPAIGAALLARRDMTRPRAGSPSADGGIPATLQAR